MIRLSKLIRLYSEQLFRWQYPVKPGPARAAFAFHRRAAVFHGDLFRVPDIDFLSAFYAVGLFRHFECVLWFVYLGLGNLTIARVGF